MYPTAQLRYVLKYFAGRSMSTSGSHACHNERFHIYDPLKSGISETGLHM